MLGPQEQMGPQAQALQQGAVSAGQVSGRCGCGGPGGTEPNMCGGQRVLCRFSCQFIVSDDQDYKVHLADPDRLVNWDYVQQVVSVISVKVQKKKKSHSAPPTDRLHPVSTAAHLQPRGPVLPHLPLPAVDGPHHPLRAHFLLAVYAALHFPERQELVQVSDLLRVGAPR